MKELLYITFLLFVPHLLTSQVVTGTVKTADGDPLTGANVFWIDGSEGTVSDEDGAFEIAESSSEKAQLAASYVGYHSDTIFYEGQQKVEFTLRPRQELDEVNISAERPDNFVSSLTPAKTEVITDKELKKGACCDLAGCFNTTASVQPNTTNVVTNSKELRILGLSGIYNQVLVDGMPLIQGLTYTYGINAIPGPLVDNIFVAKGANSVLQGFEGISGQINVEPKTPAKADKLFLNAYGNSFLESQFNAIHTTDLDKRKEWKNLAAFHTTQPGRKVDGDDDNFLDVPKVRRYVFYDKLKYRDEELWGWHSMIGMMYLHEERVGGQMDFDPATDKGSTSVYGQHISIQQPTIYTKTGYRFNDSKALSLKLSGYYNQQDSWYGQMNYRGDQLSLYGNFQYELNWGTNHDLKTGVSFRRLRVDEQISSLGNPLNKTFEGRYLKDEFIPGLFAENSFRWMDDRLTWIAGVRADHHNRFGWFFTPRSLLKYDFSQDATIRSSVGYGWRTANVFSEHINLLSSQRDVVFTETLNPEEGLNFGVNYLQRFSLGPVSGYASADVYQTRFFNQIFPDYETDPTKAYLSNFYGTSISNGVQVDLNLELFKRLKLKTAYNFLEVFREDSEGDKDLLPFVTRHKVLTTLNYQTANEAWQFDVNHHWYGRQQLPPTDDLPAHLQRSDESKPYHIVNVQVSKFWDRFELYAGAENILDFRQERPIVSWQDPFSPYFDTSSIWGPTRGIEGYIGLRYRLE